MSQSRVIVGMTGATGAILGVRILELLGRSGVDTHLIMSKWAAQTLVHETDYTVEQVKSLARHVHAPGDQAAAVSSGSFLTDGMVVAPCSMKSLAAIAHGTGETLVHRAADVVLKEGRRLVLVVRESPLSAVHLQNMLQLARLGVRIVPPMPAFYNHPQSLEDLIHHIAVRVLDQLGIHLEVPRWEGSMRAGSRVEPVRES